MWLREIPAHWEVARLGRFCEITSSKRVFEAEWKSSGIRFLRARDIASFHAGKEQEGKLFISEETYKEKISVSGELRKGDLLVTGVGTIGVPYLVDTDEKMYFKDGNIIWIKQSKKILPRFLYYLFLSQNIITQIKNVADITTVATFTIKNAKKLFIPLPPTDEQNTIAKFLDDKVSQIEKLISIRQRQIIDLSDLKKAIINKAVTKGLKHDAKMKDSGFLWLGEIPAGWEVRPIKRLFTLQTGATPDTNKPEFWDGSILWVTPSDFQTEQKYISGGKKTITQSGFASCGARLIPKDSVIFSARASVGKAVIAAADMSASQSCIACISKGYMNAEYFYYVLAVASDVLNFTAQGATFKAISASDFGNFRVPLPPADEQNEIAAYLDKKCSQINRAITNTQQQISELGELKARLISDAVTGKIDVR